MFTHLRAVFGTYTKSQEILFLLKDIKKVVRQGFYEKELLAVEQFCKENKLFLVRSRFKVRLGEEGYTNTGYTDKEGDMVFVYIAKKQRLALLASYFELVADHDGLGEVLGYPKCCREYFRQHFSPTRTDLAVPSNNPYTNLALREKDYVLLSHFPCKASCKESIIQAKKYLEIIEVTDKKRAQELFAALSK